MKCEIALNKILMKESHAKVNNVVLSRLEEFRRGLDRLVAMAEIDTAMIETFLDLWKQDQLSKLEKRRDWLPVDAYTHTRCCMVAHYRRALQQVKDFKHGDRRKH
tara:strand:+ start:2203 stop:2517 length:315 start_codon:yes stop_codon:yes gene_type:complete